jgi:hypothetical protein
MLQGGRAVTRRRKRWRPPWPIRLLGTAAALVALGIALDLAARAVGLR